MKLRRVFSPSLLVVILAISAPVRFFSFGIGPVSNWRSCGNIFVPSYHLYGSFLQPTNHISFFEERGVDIAGSVIKTPTNGGIRIEMPDKYKDKFEAWKAELLSTDFGRQQWEQYANNKEFVLTIAVSNKKDRGAGTDKYLWDDSGKFVGATITLGDDIEKGYPDPIYYPVMNSLSAEDTTYSISGRILAATKLSHEIGHVNQTANANRVLLMLQNKLMPEYTSIFLNNGRDPKDKKLVDLAKQMGGTPIEIWESREYWSEINAMLFLKERISSEKFYCFVFNKIKHNIEEYAKSYEHRFDQYSEFSNSPCWK
jgi:hypothetical protein